MNADQIKHMVDRFLMWKLPDNFSPDNGISAVRPNYAPEVSWEPTGTNLLDATQAEAMVRHMVEGLAAESPAPTDAAAQKESFVRGEMGMAAADRAQTTLKRPRPEVTVLTGVAAKLSERFAATLENEQSNAQGLDEGPSAILMGLSRADRQAILSALRALSIQKE